MKKNGILILTLVTQVQFIFAQSGELNLPSLTEEGLGNLVSSSLLQTIIFILAGLAGAMAVVYLLGNLRMTYDENRTSAGYSSRYAAPNDAGRQIDRSRTPFSSLIPQLIAVDSELEEEEEDPREETKGQRG